MIYKTSERFCLSRSPVGCTYTPRQNRIEFSPRVKLTYDTITQQNAMPYTNQKNNPQINKQGCMTGLKNRTFDQSKNRAMISSPRYNGYPSFYQSPKDIVASHKSYTSIKYSSSLVDNQRPNQHCQINAKQFNINPLLSQQLRSPISRQILPTKQTKSLNSFGINLPIDKRLVLAQENQKQLWSYAQNQPQQVITSQKSQLTENKNQSQKCTVVFSDEVNIQNLKKYSQVLQATCEKNISQQQISPSRNSIVKVISLREKPFKEQKMDERLRQFENSCQKFEISHLKSQISRVKFQNSQLREVNRRYLDKINQFKYTDGNIEAITNIEKQCQLNKKIGDLQKMVSCQIQEISQLLLQKRQSARIIETLKEEIKIMEKQMNILHQEKKDKSFFDKEIKVMSSSVVIQNQNMNAQNLHSVHNEVLQFEKDKMKYSYYSTKQKEGEMVNPQDCYFEILDIFGIQKQNQDSLNILISEIVEIKKQLQELFLKCQSYQTNKNIFKKQLQDILLNDQVSPEKRIVDCFNLLKNGQR